MPRLAFGIARLLAQQELAVRAEDPLDLAQHPIDALWTNVLQHGPGGDKVERVVRERQLAAAGLLEVEIRIGDAGGGQRLGVDVDAGVALGHRREGRAEPSVTATEL